MRYTICTVSYTHLAAESTRYYYLKIDEKNCQAAVFLASDGIEDSYRTLELSQCFYRDVCEKLVLDGVESTTRWLLEGELSQISLEGSEMCIRDSSKLES